MQFFKICTSVVLLWVSLSTVYSASQLASYFKICHLSDRDLAGCLKTSLYAAAKTLVNGIPALGLPRVDPFYVNTVDISDKLGGVNFKQTLTDLNIVGMSSFTIDSAQVDTVAGTMKMKMTSPSIDLSSKFNMNVKLLGIPVKGSGEAKMSFTNIASTVNIQAEKYTSGGTEYFRIKNFDWDIDPETAKFNFVGIGDTLNKFINSNWKAAFALYKQIPEEAFADMIKDRVNAILAKFPANELFPN